MANPTLVTIAALVAGGSLADPAPQVVDTGTTKQTIPCNPGGVTDRLFFRVKNLAAAALTFGVAPGDYPPAMRSPIGGYTGGTQTTLQTFWHGPFESGQFIQDDGTLNLEFTPASGTVSAEVTAFRLPVV